FVVTNLFVAPDTARLENRTNKFVTTKGAATILAMLTIAISKGRLQDETLALFARAGLTADENALNSRRLLVGTSDGRCNFIFVKPGDVPTYVEYGVADAGVCGRDVLLESQ